MAAAPAPAVLYLQRAVGAGGIHAPAAAEEIVEEATGTAPTEARTGQPEAPLRSGTSRKRRSTTTVATAIDLPHIGAVIAHRCNGACRVSSTSSPDASCEAEIQPHHHAHALLRTASRHR